MAETPTGRVASSGPHIASAAGSRDVTSTPEAVRRIVAASLSPAKSQRYLPNFTYACAPGERLIRAGLVWGTYIPLALTYRNGIVSPPASFRTTRGTPSTLQEPGERLTRTAVTDCSPVAAVGRLKPASVIAPPGHHGAGELLCAVA
jgi:hypothetical protein